MTFRSIRVHFDDGDTITTSINGTNESITRYYVGQQFNLGQPHDPTADRVVTAIRVEFLN